MYFLTKLVIKVVLSVNFQFFFKTNYWSCLECKFYQMPIEILALKIKLNSQITLFWKPTFKL